MAVNFHRGTTSMRDYTPGGAVAAGTVVTIAPLQYVSHLPIAAGELGALACPSGGAAYKLTTDQNIADGAAVLVNVGTGVADGTGVHFGYAEGAANGTVTATTVIVRHSMITG
jgi:predicted RecA/RadA family phage recombinase